MTIYALLSNFWISFICAFFPPHECLPLPRLAGKCSVLHIKCCIGIDVRRDIFMIFKFSPSPHFFASRYSYYPSLAKKFIRVSWKGFAAENLFNFFVFLDPQIITRECGHYIQKLSHQSLSKKIWRTGLRGIIAIFGSKYCDGSNISISTSKRSFKPRTSRERVCLSVPLFIGPRYTWGPIYGSECL